MTRSFNELKQSQRKSQPKFKSPATRTGTPSEPQEKSQKLRWRSEELPVEARPSHERTVPASLQGGHQFTFQQQWSLPDRGHDQARAGHAHDVPAGLQDARHAEGLYRLEEDRHAGMRLDGQGVVIRDSAHYPEQQAYQPRQQPTDLRHPSPHNSDVSYRESLQKLSPDQQRRPLVDAAYPSAHESQDCARGLLAEPRRVHANLPVGLRQPLSHSRDDSQGETRSEAGVVYQEPQQGARHATEAREAPDDRAQRGERLTPRPGSEHVYVVRQRESSQAHRKPAARLPLSTQGVFSLRLDDEDQTLDAHDTHNKPRGLQEGHRLQVRNRHDDDGLRHSFTSNSKGPRALDGDLPHPGPATELSAREPFANAVMESANLDPEIEQVYLTQPEDAHHPWEVEPQYQSTLAASQSLDVQHAWEAQPQFYQTSVSQPEDAQHPSEVEYQQTVIEQQTRFRPSRSQQPFGNVGAALGSLR